MLALEWYPAAECRCPVALPQLLRLLQCVDAVESGKSAGNGWENNKSISVIII